MVYGRFGGDFVEDCVEDGGIECGEEFVVEGKGEDGHDGQDNVFEFGGPYMELPGRKTKVRGGGDGGCGMGGESKMVVNLGVGGIDGQGSDKS